MRLLTSAFLICSLPAFSSQAPIWELDPRFVYYNSLCIANNLSSLQVFLVKMAEKHPEDLEEICDAMMDVASCQYMIQGEIE